MRLCYTDITEQTDPGWNGIKELLPWEERKRKSERYRFRKDRYRCIAAGALLKKMLTDEGVKDFEVVRDEHGKPRLKNYTKLHFNISHSGDYAVCALGDSPVGVDIESLGSADLKVAGRFFTEGEYEWIMKKDAEERFIRIWTLKESYVKYKGQGLGLSFRKFEIIPDEKKPEDAFFEEYNLEGYCLSLCKSGGDRVRPEKISFKYNI